MKKTSDKDREHAVVKHMLSRPPSPKNAKTKKKNDKSTSLKNSNK